MSLASSFLIVPDEKNQGYLLYLVHGHLILRWQEFHKSEAEQVNQTGIER